MIKMHAKLPPHNSKSFQLLGWVKNEKKRQPTLADVVQAGGAVNQNMLE